MFGELYKAPSRNGLMKPKAVRGDGFKFINMGEVFTHDRLLNVPTDRVPATLSEVNNFRLIPGDLLFARQSLVLAGAGKCSIFVRDDSEDVLFESHLIRVRLNEEEIDSFYLFYYFRSPLGRGEIYSITEQGAGQSGIRGSDLERINISYPPLPTQKAIAHILGTLDDKIELNRKMNSTLEAMAQTLFQSWFVDFDPVIDNALDSGNPIPEALQARAQARANLGKDRKPLPEEMQKLFPSKFVQHKDMGWIPEGWEVKAVSEAININPSYSLKAGHEAFYVDMKALPTSGYTISDINRRIFSNGSKFANGDVLLARITPCLENGKTGIVDFLSEGEVGFGSTEFIVLSSNPTIKTPFIACLSRMESFRKHCITNMIGSSGRQRVQNACFDKFRICVPDKIQILDLFYQSVQANFNSISLNRAETIALANLRDTLLPKLLSGQLQVPDAEKLVAGVL